MRSWKVILVILVTAAAVGIAYFNIFDRRHNTGAVVDVDETHDEPAGAPPVAAVSGGSSIKSQIPEVWQPSNTASAARWWAAMGEAATYESTRADLQRSYGPQSPEAASFEAQWLLHCFRMLSLPDVPGWMTEAASRFCDGDMPFNDIASVQNHIAGLQTVDRMIRIRIGEAERDIGVDAALDIAIDELASAQDPFRIRTALDYLRLAGLLQPELADVYVPADPKRHTEVYYFARDLYICARFGGCGREHPLSLGYCLEYRCQAPADLTFIVFQNTTPNEVALINWYLQLFHSMVADR